MVQVSFSDDVLSLEEPRGVRKTRGRGRPPKVVAQAQGIEGDEDLVNGYLSADEQLVLAREIKTLAQWRAVKGLEEQRVGRELSMAEWARLLRVSEGNLERQMRQSFLARSTLVTTNMMLVYSVAHKALKGLSQGDKADGGRYTHTHTHRTPPFSHHAPRRLSCSMLIEGIHLCSFLCLHQPVAGGPGERGHAGSAACGGEV